MGPGTDRTRQPVLDVHGLSAGWGPMRVIHDLDLTVFSGERIGLVGLNGHGKSTLFQAIAGLTGWQRGSIKLNGFEVGRTRSQGPGRYTHQIVRRGLGAHSARRRDLSWTDRRGTSRQRGLHQAGLGGARRAQAAHPADLSAA